MQGKHCPFCSNNEELDLIRTAPSVNGLFRAYVQCAKCKATGPVRDYEETAVTGSLTHPGWDWRPAEAALERRIRDLEARLREREWRPIETAPQSSYGNKPTLLGYKRFAQRYIVGSQEHLVANGATHWMPLPTPPSCAKVSRGRAELEVARAERDQWRPASEAKPGQRYLGGFICSPPYDSFVKCVTFAPMGNGWSCDSGYHHSPPDVIIDLPSPPAGPEEVQPCGLVAEVRLLEAGRGEVDCG